MQEPIAKKPDGDLEAEYRRIHRQFVYAALVSLAVLFIGALFYHTVQHLSWVDALYFCVITLTTIGYGDIVPNTPVEKLFTTGYVLVGIGILAAFVNIMIKNAVVGRQFRQTNRKRTNESD